VSRRDRETVALPERTFPDHGFQQRVIGPRGDAQVRREILV
jgi:hypothetical protein